MDTLTYSALIGGAKNFSTEEKIPTEKPSTFWTGKIIEIQWGLPFESFRFDQPFGRRIRGEEGKKRNILRTGFGLCWTVQAITLYSIYGVFKCQS